MTNDERNPKPEGRKTLGGAFAGFVLRILSFLRISSFVIRICEEWFMESRHSLLHMHWDHEPTPNPSQEGNGPDADELLLPSWEGSGVGRFMESPLGRAAVHRDHEPAGQTLGAPASRRRGRRRSQARFMESLHSLLRMHWDHES